MPSWRTLRKLCVEMAIMFGLEACVKKIFQGIPAIWNNNQDYAFYLNFSKYLILSYIYFAPSIRNNPLDLTT